MQNVITIFLHISFNNVQKIFSTPNHFHFSLHLEKKIASKEGNHTTEIIERERKKEKKKGQRARFSFLSTSAENCVIPFPDDG